MPFIIFDPATTSAAVAFLIVFAVVTSLLTIANVLKNKWANVLIGVAFGIIAAGNASFATMLYSYGPPVVGLLLIIFFAVFIKRLVAGDDEKNKKRDMLPMAVALASLLIVLMVFGDAVAAMVPGLRPDVFMGIAGIAVILIIFYAAYKHSPPAPAAA